MAGQQSGGGFPGWLLGGREKAAATETQSCGFLRSLGELLSFGSVSHVLALGCPRDPLYHQCYDSLLRTLSWIILRERIYEWVGNARSSFKTCKRVLLLLLLLVGAGVCSDVTNLHGLGRPWSGDDVKFRGDGSLCLYSDQLMTVTEQVLLSVLHHLGA